MLINIKKVSNKRDFMDLLLLADPSKQMIEKYLDKSEMFVLSVNGEAACEAVVAKMSDSVCELKNLATAVKYRKQGFAKQMMQFLFQNYKTQFVTMLVGTSNPDFYEKFGFEYSHTIDGFFTKNYSEPIIDDGVQCIDMTYLRKDLHTKAKTLTRSEESMLSLILDIAKKDERIRAVGMNGSRVNSKAPKDFFQDYDIVYLVNDYASFVQDSSWVNIFGRRLIMQLPDTMNPVPNRKRFAYLMQFIDGNRLDLTILPSQSAKEYATSDSLITILLDKDNLFPILPEASDHSHWVKQPTIKEYSDCCNEFWWICTYVAKGIWRQELPYATYHIEHFLRKELLKMFNWRVGIENNFEISVGKCDKYLENYISKEMFEKFSKTYNLCDYDHCWDAMFGIIDLFRRTATFVSEKLEFPYNSDDDKNVYAFLRHIRSLPSNAKSLYEE